MKTTMLPIAAIAPVLPTAKRTRLSLALLAAGCLLGTSVSAQNLPIHSTGTARIVTDGKLGSPEDLIFSIALAADEQLRGVSLDDNGLVTSLNSQFVLIGQEDGYSRFRLTPAIDFDNFIGYSATLKLSIAGPNGVRDQLLPLQVAPLAAISEALNLRQAIADNTSSFIPQWPLRQAGDLSVTDMQTQDGTAFAYQLSTDAAGRLLATAPSPLALPQASLGLRINRQISPSGLSTSQLITLTPIAISALNASLDIQPDTTTPTLRFTVPGAWNTDVLDLLRADLSGASLLSRFHRETLDNGDTRFTLLPQQNLNDLGYPAQALSLSLQRRFAGTTGRQTLRLLAPTTTGSNDAAAGAADSSGHTTNLLTGRAASTTGTSGTTGSLTATLPPLAIVSPQPRQEPATVKPSARANSFAAARPLTGDITYFQHDAVGNLTHITDPLGRTTQNTYDPLNRVVQTSLPDFSGSTPTISNAYDGQDQITQVTDPRGLITRYQIDGLGNVTQITSPDSGTTAQSQDSLGNLVSKTDARGQTQTRSYDALNRLTSIVYNGATGNQLAQVQYQYDIGSNAIGRLSAISELDTSGNTLNLTRYTYDSMGRLSQETRTLPGSSPSTLGYSYAPGGALASLTLPSGRTVNYTRDAAGRIAAIDTTASGQTQAIVSNVSYHAFGGVKAYTLGNGQTVTRTQDTQGRLTSYTLGGTTQSISYDPASRITAITKAGDATNSNSYGFDNLDRLTSATRSAQTQSYTYDVNGNRLTRQLAGQTDQYNIDPASNRISSVTTATVASYQYDAAGNLQNDGSRQLTYDSRGRLTQAILAAAPSLYQVDAAGRRIRKQIGTAQEIHFHYDRAGHLVAESRPDGSVIREILYLLDIPVVMFQ